MGKLFKIKQKAAPFTPPEPNEAPAIAAPTIADTKPNEEAMEKRRMNQGRASTVIDDLEDDEDEFTAMKKLLGG